MEALDRKFKDVITVATIKDIQVLQTLKEGLAVYEAKP